MDEAVEEEEKEDEAVDEVMRRWLGM